MKGQKLERPLLLCIREPLPHVVAYLRTFKDICEEATRPLNQAGQRNIQNNIMELREKGAEVGRIRDAVIRLGKELQASSNLYFDRALATPASVLKIAERVGHVPELVRKLRKFVDRPEDLEYELGVEPILSERGPWASRNTSFSAKQRLSFS